MHTRSMGLLLMLAATLAACGDEQPLFPASGPTGSSSSSSSSSLGPTETLDPSAPGVTGTVPLPGPADGLRWTPAGSIDPVSEEELTAALEELGIAMVIPTSAPPLEGAATATFRAQGLGWGSGRVLSMDVSLSVEIDREWVVRIRTWDEAGCWEGAPRRDFRGDPEACVGADRLGDSIRWHEAGRRFEATFIEDTLGDELPLEEALGWLESWRLLSPSLGPSATAAAVVPTTAAPSTSVTDVAPPAPLPFRWEAA